MALAMEGVVGSGAGSAALARVTITRGHADLAPLSRVARLAHTQKPAVPIPSRLAAAVETRGHVAPGYLLSEE